MWVLIVVIIYSGVGITSEKIEGFTSQKYCLEQAEKLNNLSNNVKCVCIQVK